MLPADPYQSPKPSFPRPVAPPSVDPDEPPLMTVCFNRAWVAVLLGAATQLLQLATWDTTDPDEALLAQSRANLLISMLAGDTASRAPGEEIPICEGTMSYDIRVKEGQPWITEFSTDGGTTWHDAIVQPHWGGDGTAIVWPAITGSADAGSAAGGMIAGGPIALAGDILTQDGDGFSRDVIQNNLYAEFARMNALPEGLNQIRTVIDSLLDNPTPTAYTDQCTYSDFWTQLQAFLLDHPNDFNNLLGGWIIDQVGSISDATLKALVSLFGALGPDAWYQYIANNGNSLRVPTFGDSCTWSHTFDFTTGEHGWSAVANFISAGPCVTGSSGVYVSGEGYQPLLEPLSSPTSDTRYQVYIMITFPARTVTEVDMEFTGLGNTIGQSPDNCQLLNDANYQTSPHVFDVTDDTYTSMCLSLRTDADTQRVTAATLHGIGFDPFP